MFASKERNLKRKEKLSQLVNIVKQKFEEKKDLDASIKQTLDEFEAEISSQKKKVEKPETPTTVGSNENAERYQKELASNEQFKIINKSLFKKIEAFLIDFELEDEDDYVLDISENKLLSILSEKFGEAMANKNIKLQTVFKLLGLLDKKSINTIEDVKKIIDGKVIPETTPTNSSITAGKESNVTVKDEKKPNVTSSKENKSVFRPSDFEGLADSEIAQKITEKIFKDLNSNSDEFKKAAYGEISDWFTEDSYVDFLKKSMRKIDSDFLNGVRNIVSNSANQIAEKYEAGKSINVETMKKNLRIRLKNFSQGYNVKNESFYDKLRSFVQLIRS
jgi:hypothetical protein